MDPSNWWSKNVFNCCKIASLFVTLWWFPRWRKSCSTTTCSERVKSDIWSLNKLFLPFQYHHDEQTEIQIIYIWTIQHTVRGLYLGSTTYAITVFNHFKPVFKIIWPFEINSNTKCLVNNWFKSLLALMATKKHENIYVINELRVFGRSSVEVLINIKKRITDLNYKVIIFFCRPFFLFQNIGTDWVNDADSSDIKILVQFPRNSILKVSTNFWKSVGVWLFQYRYPGVFIWFYLN